MNVGRVVRFGVRTEMTVLLAAAHQLDTRKSCSNSFVRSILLGFTLASAVGQG